MRTNRTTKVACWMLMAASALACGGNADTGPDESGDAYEEEGLDEKASSNFGYGFESVEASHGTVNVGCGNNINKFCMYPGDKSRKFCVTGTGMTAAQKTEAEADVDAILPTFASQFGGAGWSFSRSCSNTPDVLIEYGNISASQAKTNIMGYVSAMPQAGSLNQVFPLGAGGTHWQQKPVTGQFVVRVDRAQIITDFDSTAREQRVRRHALYGGMYAAGAGLGFRSNHTNQNTSISITQDSAKVLTLSATELCRANGYDPLAPDFWLQTFGC